MTTFNRAKAYSDFIKTLEKEKEFFKENGMSAEDTEIIAEFTKQQYKDDRNYYEHNISLNIFTKGMEEEGRSPFLVMAWDVGLRKRKTDKKDEYIYLSWIETIKNEKLKDYLCSLSIEDKIIFIEIFFNKKTQVELAERLGISRQTVAKRYKKIFKEMQLVLKED